MNRAQEHASLARSAYNSVRQRIVRGELPIGQVISRRRIANELGMSFLPVSEALQRLEVEGLLESRPRAGTRVRIPTRQDIVGHYAVREALEVQAARMFAQTASQQECDEVLKLAIRVDDLRAKPNRGLYAVTHEKFHRMISEYGRCPALAEALEKIRAVALTWMCTAHPAGTVRANRHEELVRGLIQHDPEIAEKAMRHHILSSRERSLERLQPYFSMRRKHGRVFTRGERTRSVAAAEA